LHQGTGPLAPIANSYFRSGEEHNIDDRLVLAAESDREPHLMREGEITTKLRETRGKGAVAACLLLAACAGQPLIPYSADTPPLVLTTAAQAGVQDKRARFREIYCAVLEARGRELPDYRPCDDALTRVGAEPSGTGRPVDLGQSRRHFVAALVPGLGWGCIVNWLEPPGTAKRHMQKYGYDLMAIKVDALSGTERNAREIRDALMAMPAEAGPPRVVLIGYSKGTPDILEAIVRYPEIRGRLAAVVSVAGAVGGSPLANDADQSDANLLRYFPGATCDAGDGGAVESLRPAVRKAWLAQHPLPPEVPYYSVVALPQPERISWFLQFSYAKLARVDGRNDSQIIFYDEVIPGSSLIGYLNADHWAIAVPIGRTHTIISTLFVTQNAYPREALLEAVLRFVEEDLAAGVK
jgi:pimeloyl-ACP methyl ester carboxylesterase